MLDRTQRLRRGGYDRRRHGDRRRHCSRAVAAARARTTSRTRCTRPGRPRTRSCNLITPFFWVAVVDRRRRGRGDLLRRAPVPGEAGRGARPGAGPRQHRARDQLDDHPVPDPRGDGGPDRRHDLQPRQDPEGPERRPRRRRRRGSGAGSTSTPTRAPASTPPTRCTSRSAGRSCLDAHERQRDPLVLGPGARRQEGRRPGHPQHAHDRGRASPARYLGQCAEYCGLSHANMRLRVIAQTQADYDKWVAEQQAQLSKSTQAAVRDDSRSKWGCHELPLGHEPHGAEAREHRAEPHARRRPRRRSRATSTR